MIKAIQAACPEYRGAPQPKFDPSKINESRIPDNMRFKEYGYAQGEGREDLTLEWETQEPYTSDDISVFLAEIRRAFEANHCTGKLTVRLSDRDEECEPSTHVLEFKEA